MSHFKHFEKIKAGFICLLLVASQTIGMADNDNSTAPGKSSNKTVAPSSDPKNLESISAPQSSTASESPFKFRVGIPAWASGVSGDVGVRGVSGHFDVPFSSLFNHLDAIAPLSMDASYGKWGVHLDGQYVKLSENFSTQGTLFESGTLEMEQAFANFNINYRVVDSAPFTLVALVGARYNYLSLHGTLQSARPRLIENQDESGNVSWADPILGLNAKVQVAKPVALVFTGDVGGFGAASDLTYQLFGGAEVQLTRCFYTRTGYRYIYTDYSQGGSTYKMEMSGPEMEFGFNF
jgi:hypothetical protein